MVIIKEFIDTIQRTDCVLTNLAYFLNASDYNSSSVKSNFNNNKVSWTDIPYIWDIKGRLHFLINDSRVQNYKTMYVRSVFLIEDKEVNIPSFVFKDIKSLNKYEDSLTESKDNWIIVDLGYYNIACGFDYSSKNLFQPTSNLGGVYNRHFHAPGKIGGPNVLMDISDFKNSTKGMYKCLMSRGVNSKVGN